MDIPTTIQRQLAFITEKNLEKYFPRLSFIFKISIMRACFMKFMYILMLVCGYIECSGNEMGLHTWKTQLKKEKTHIYNSYLEWKL